jgi:hypothetical protein
MYVKAVGVSGMHSEHQVLINVSFFNANLHTICSYHVYTSMGDYVYKYV